MRGISFREGKTFSGEDFRDDIACFIGFAFPAVQPDISSALVDWWRRFGWLERARSDRFPVGAVKKLRAGEWYLDDMPVPLNSWNEFLSLFAPGRPDVPGEIVGEALPELIDINAEAPPLRLFADGRQVEIPLPVKEIAPDDLATYLETALAKEKFPVTASTFGDDRIILKQRYPQREIFFSVTRNELLGFADYASIRVWSLEGCLATAVRQFFAEGGTSCYVIAIAPPLPLSAVRAQRLSGLCRLISGPKGDEFLCGTVEDFIDAAASAFTDVGAPRIEWHGARHLLGLEDVALVSFPDLPDLCGSDSESPEVETVRPKEIFREYAPSAVPSPRSAARHWSAPHLDEEGYLVWRTALEELLRQVRLCGSAVQLIASVPLSHPSFGLFPEKPLRAFLDAPSGDFDHRDAQLSFLHLIYPWLRAGGVTPGGIESPEGVFAGILARLAASTGPFRTAAGSALRQLRYGFEPSLFQPRDQEADSHATPQPEVTGAAVESGLRRQPASRVACFGRTSAGIRLFSDVTASPLPDLGQGGIRRLISSVSRRCRSVGTRIVFEPNGPAVRQQATRIVEGALADFYKRGAFRGKSADEAFSVRCNRDTMTINDEDNGRIVTEVQMWPAAAVERISVTLSVAGEVSGGRS